ncbi:Sec-independent protein translocase family protein [Rickettsiella massiliensis]|uniref:hypothetical protein n=1 Tax=Rickettsiella massiliensis TaxID=676517 RepID=UPI00029A785B|nr:hypothetical protein [Rickettsiella massiliensis]
MPDSVYFLFRYFLYENLSKCVPQRNNKGLKKKLNYGATSGSLLVIALMTLLVLGPARLQMLVKTLTTVLQQLHKTFSHSEKNQSNDKPSTDR